MYRIKRHQVGTMVATRNYRYLLTDKKGSFISSGLCNNNTRSDDAIFMKSFNYPVSRYKIVHKLRETLIINGEEYNLTTQEYVNQTKNEDGYHYFLSYEEEYTPTFKYFCKGILLIKRVTFSRRTLQVALDYKIINNTSTPCELRVTPEISGHPLGEYKAQGEYHYKINNNNGITAFLSEYEENIFIKGSTRFIETTPTFIGDYYLYDDAKDGRDSICSSMNYGYLTKEVKANFSEEFSIILSSENSFPKSAKELIVEEEGLKKELLEKSEAKSSLAKKLTLASDHFLTDRSSTMSKTIIAGYPFFGDWGRDTFIAFAGICLTTKRYAEARSILETFIKYEKDGLLPNNFALDGSDPHYNTVDAPLLFIKSVYEYYLATGDLDFIAHKAYQKIKNIICAYGEGTKYNIYMDSDGLIYSGEKNYQLTWMDVRIGDHLPTPRHGKVVEINGLWYNALNILNFFSEKLGLSDPFDTSTLIPKVKKSFKEVFGGGAYLNDFSSNYDLRPNQVWVFDLNFPILEGEEIRPILTKILEKLYTPNGMRTLEIDNPQFKEVIGGSQKNRDLSYHQGTVWPFIVGGFMRSYLHYFPEQKDFVRELFSSFEDNLEEYCIGQIAEIFDGRYPNKSKGCYAQAWSVAELLSVARRLER